MLLSESQQINEFSLAPLKQVGGKVAGKFAAVFNKLAGIAADKMIKAATNYIVKKVTANKEEGISTLEKVLNTIEKASPQLGQKMEALFKSKVGGATKNECFEIMYGEMMLNEGLASAAEDGVMSVIGELVFGWLKELFQAFFGEDEMGKMLPLDRAMKLFSALVTLGVDIALCFSAILLLAFLQHGGAGAREMLEAMAEPVNTVIHFIRNLF